jgi:hypothetical protein
MNIDDAGDEAEIARQVLTSLVDQLRAFSSGARSLNARLCGEDAA